MVSSVYFYFAVGGTCGQCFGEIKGLYVSFLNNYILFGHVCFDWQVKVDSHMPLFTKELL